MMRLSVLNAESIPLTEKVLEDPLICMCFFHYLIEMYTFTEVQAATEAMLCSETDSFIVSINNF